MTYNYDRTKRARVPGEFPETEYSRFTKHLNLTLLECGNIKKSLERERRFPTKVKAVEGILRELLEIRQDMLWVSTGKGDSVRTR